MRNYNSEYMETDCAKPIVFSGKYGERIELHFKQDITLSEVSRIFEMTILSLESKMWQHDYAGFIRKHNLERHFSIENSYNCPEKVKLFE